MSLNREVALKVVLAGGHASPAQRQRFLREAEAAAALNHSGVVQVYEVGEHAGLPYMALELCTGGNLADKLAGTPLPPAEAAALVEALALAVQAAHGRGVVHRDIKPANILLAADGTPKIADFGLAKLTESGDGMTASGAVFGTPSYMAPEQAKGETNAVGPPADVYALGAVLYECLTGRPPFKAASAAETLLQVLNQEPAAVRSLNPVVPSDLETVCLKCLEKEGSRRYSSAAALGDDLRRWLDGRPVQARPVGPLGRGWKWVRRNPVVAAALSAVAVSLLTGAAVSYAQYRAADRARVQAVAESVSKEEALLALQQANTDQARTLQQLEAEKAATEDAFAQGVLRSLRSERNPFDEYYPRPEEAAALEALSLVPNEDVRLRFIERAISSPRGSARLAAWPAEVVWAIAGLDRMVATRLRSTVGRLMQAPETGPDGRAACAVLVSYLPTGDPALDGLAALVLADRLTSGKDETARQQGFVLGNLARRLSSAQAGQVVRLLSDRLALANDPEALKYISIGIRFVAARLGPLDCKRLTVSLVSRLITEADVSAADQLSSSVTTFSERLSADEVAPAAESLARHMAAEADSANLRRQAPTLDALLGRMDAPEAERLCAPLARTVVMRIATAEDRNAFSNFAGVTESLAAWSIAADTGMLARALVERLANEKDLNTYMVVAIKLVAVTKRLAPAEAGLICGPLTKGLAERVVTEPDPAVKARLAATVGTMASRLGSADAEEAIAPLAKSLGSERDPEVLRRLGGAVKNLAGRLGPGRAAQVCGPLSAALADQLASEKQSVTRKALPSVLGSVSKHLRPADIAPLARRLSDRLAAEKNADLASDLAIALAELAGHVSPADATIISGQLFKAALTEPGPECLTVLGETLSALATSVDAADVPETCGPLARFLAARMVDRNDAAGTVLRMARVIAALTERLGPAERGKVCGPAAKALSERLANEDSPDASDALVPLAESLLLLSERLGPAEAAAVCEPPARALVAGPNDDDLAIRAQAFAILAGRMGQKSAATMTQKLVERFEPERDKDTRAALVGALTEMTGALADDALLDLFKSRGHYSGVQSGMLMAFARQAGVCPIASLMFLTGSAAGVILSDIGFEDVWEFVDWAEKNRPDLDLKSRPRKLEASAGR